VKQNMSDPTQLPTNRADNPETTLESVDTSLGANLPDQTTERLLAITHTLAEMALVQWQELQRAISENGTGNAGLHYAGVREMLDHLATLGEQLLQVLPAPDPQPDHPGHQTVGSLTLLRAASEVLCAGQRERLNQAHDQAHDQARWLEVESTLAWQMECRLRELLTHWYDCRSRSPVRPKRPSKRINYWASDADELAELTEMVATIQQASAENG